MDIASMIFQWYVIWHNNILHWERDDWNKWVATLVGARKKPTGSWLEFQSPRWGLTYVNERWLVSGRQFWLDQLLTFGQRFLCLSFHRRLELLLSTPIFKPFGCQRVTFTSTRSDRCRARAPQSTSLTTNIRVVRGPGQVRPAQNYCTFSQTVLRVGPDRTWATTV